MSFRFLVPFKAFPGCGWKALDLPLFILNKSDSSPHLKNLYSHLHSGLLDVNMSLCVAFLLAQASEFESFWTGSNMRQLWQAGRPLITVNYPSGREAPKPAERCSYRALHQGVSAYLLSNRRVCVCACVFMRICALPSSIRRDMLAFKCRSRSHDGKRVLHHSLESKAEFVKPVKHKRALRNSWIARL